VRRSVVAGPRLATCATNSKRPWQPLAVAVYLITATMGEFIAWIIDGIWS